MQDIETRPAPRPRRKESLIGVCQALGDDFGFNPDILRVALAMMLLVNAEATAIAYVTAGVLILFTHLLIREPRRTAAPVA